jgi:hypothetical protein
VNIFISYGHNDPHGSHLLAERLNNDLCQKGYTVWIDTEKLREKGGLEWERYLEDGIASADRVLAIMTPHTVNRRNGYCNKEIAYAVDAFSKSAKKRIIPIMLAPCKPPLSIYNLQYHEIQDLIINGTIDETRYTTFLERLIESIEREDFEYEGQQIQLKTNLYPINFTSDIARHLKDFEPRPWVIEHIERWLTESQSPYFLIKGVPGSGKSALIAWLSSQLESVDAIHFFARLDAEKGSLPHAISSLAYQLTTQIPDYRTILIEHHDYLNRMKHIKEETTNPLEEAVALFRIFIIEPLNRLEDSPQKLHLILLDGVDLIGEPMIQFLEAINQELPTWLRFIISSNPLRNLYDLNINHIAELNAETSQTEASNYIRKQLSKKISDDDEIKTLTAELLRKSQGNFLYLKLVLHDYLQGTLTHFPDDLNSYYPTLMKRLFPDIDEYDEKIAPLLELLCAYPAGLHKTTIQEVRNLKPRKLNQVLHDIAYITHQSDGYVTLFHNSFIEWLTTDSLNKQSPYAIDTTEGFQQFLPLIERLDTINQDHTITPLLHALVELNQEDAWQRFSNHLIKQNHLIEKVSKHLYTLAQTYSFKNRTSQAIILLEKWYHTLDALYKKDPYQWAKDYTTSLNNLAYS